MANQKSPIHSVPLQAKLNLNRNKAVINTNFDQLNNQNSPVHGGCLSPIMYQQRNTGQVGIFDRFGNYYAYNSSDGGLWKYSELPETVNTRIGSFNPSDGRFHNIKLDLPDSEKVFDLGIDNSGYYYLFGMNNDVEMWIRKYNSSGGLVAQSGIGYEGSILGIHAAVKATQGYMVIAAMIRTGDGPKLRVVQFNTSLSATCDWTEPFALYAYWDGKTSMAANKSSIPNRYYITISNSYNNVFGISVFDRRPAGDCSFQLQWRNAICHVNSSQHELPVWVSVYNPGTIKDIDVNPDGSTKNGQPGNQRQGAKDYMTGVFVDNTNAVVQANLCIDKSYDYSDDHWYVWVVASEFTNISVSGDTATVTSCTRWAPVLATEGAGENGYGVIDELYNSSLALGNGYGRVYYAANMDADGDSDGSNWDYSCLGCGMLDINDPEFSVRSYAGCQTNTTWSKGSNAKKPFEGYRSSIWGNIHVEGKNQQYLSTGSCRQYGSFRVLYNYRQGYISNFSYNGVIVAEWDTIDDSCGFAAVGAQLLYKDVKGDIRVVRRGSYLASSDLQLIDDRYILVPLCQNNNLYDTVTGKWETFGSDWNNRIITGQVVFKQIDNDTFYNFSNSYREYNYSCAPTGTIGSGYRVGYQAMKSFAPGRMWPYIQVNNIRFGEESAMYNQQDIDYYRSYNTTASPTYAYTFGASGTIQTNGAAESTAYPTTSTGTAYNNMPPNCVEFKNNYNGKFSVKINGTMYTMMYDGTRPIALYNTTSMVQEVGEFFIIQSQYYAIINNYICAISYSSNNTINGIDSILDVTGMTFIGALPSVAYFYSPAARAIFAFTGDADLQLFVQSDAITQVNISKYCPNNEWLVFATNNGTYVISQLNVFRISDRTDWDDIAFKGKYIIGRVGVQLWFYWLQDATTSSYESTIPIILETEYFGPGNNVECNIDCWYVRLFNRKGTQNQTLKYYTKVLTDRVSTSAEKEIQITPDMWDEENQCYIRLQPEFQKGQGISLHLESPYPIISLSCSMKADVPTVGAIQI